MRSVTLPGYSAYGNRLHLDAIRLGRNAFVGEQSLLDIGASIGDFGELGHASSLQRGQRVPDGKRYAGSPAEETATQLPARRRYARPVPSPDALHRGPPRAHHRGCGRADRDGRRLSDERADPGRRRARAEAVRRDLRHPASGCGDGAGRHARRTGRVASRHLHRAAAGQHVPCRRQGLSALRLPPRHAADRRASRAIRSSSA